MQLTAIQIKKKWIKFYTTGNSTIERIYKSDHITAIGCQPYLPLSVVNMKRKWVFAENPHCHNGVVDMFGHGLSNNP